MIDDSYLEGLDPNDYHAQALRAVRSSLTDLDALAPTERAELRSPADRQHHPLGYHLRFGKVDPNALDPNWNSSRELVGEDPAVTIQAAIDSPSLREFAARVIPRAFLYERFKKALADYRAIEANGGWPERAGRPDAAAGRQRRARPGARGAARRHRRSACRLRPPSTGTSYDGALVDGRPAVSGAPRARPDGIVGAATLAALNVPVAARVEQIRANLERAAVGALRSRERVPGRQHRGVPALSPAPRRRRVAHSRAGRPPVSADADLQGRDDLSRRQSRPGPCRRASSATTSCRRSAAIPTISPRAISSSSIRASSSSIPPPWTGPAAAFRTASCSGPAPDNALGRIKFMFPNEHSVYLHDTPSRDLFDRDSRAFSSGCIRVENPFELAEQLLGVARSRAARCAWSRAAAPRPFFSTSR